MPKAEDLRRLLDSRYEWEHAEIELKPEKEKLYRLLFENAYREAAAFQATLSRHAFLDAIDVCYKKHRTARRKSEMGSVPPQQRGQ